MKTGYVPTKRGQYLKECLYIVIGSAALTGLLALAGHAGGIW